MAYRSWLKDVRSIHDLGEQCHALSFRKPEDKDRDAGYDEKWLKRLRSDIPVADAYNFAFGSRMHDSWVEWVKRSSSELRIRVNNDFAQHFLQQIADMLDVHIPTFLNTKYRPEIDLELESRDWVAPVDLIFDDPSYVNAVRQGPGGKLRWSEWRDIGRRVQPYQADQFLHDWFFEQGGRIQCIIAIWAPKVGNASCDTIHLLIDCIAARANDGRAAAIAKVFSPAVVDIWNDLMARVDLGPDWDGWRSVRDYIERRMLTRGLTVNDLTPINEKVPWRSAKGHHIG